MLVNCASCLNDFEKSNKKISSHRRLGRKQHYCSQKCLHNWQSSAFAKAKAVIVKVTEQLPDGVKRCPKCHVPKELKFFGNKSWKRLRSCCSQCLYDAQCQRWLDRKVKAINYLGGKCVKCGWKGHPAAFDFHHRDPSTKDMEWHKMRLRNWASVLVELDKCDLLCAICHRITHATPV